MWFVQIFRRSGVERPHIELIPGPVDVEVFDPSKYTPLPLPIGNRVFGKKAWGHGHNRPFVFLSIFAWQDRKGWDVQLRAFLEEFGPQSGVARAQPEVVLVLVTHAYSPTEDSDYVGRMRKWAELAGIIADAADMEELETLPQVYVTDEHISDHDLGRLYKAVDAFVLSTRYIGLYGMFAMQSTACAGCSQYDSMRWQGLKATVPVIATCVCMHAEAKAMGAPSWRP